MNFLNVNRLALFLFIFFITYSCGTKKAVEYVPVKTQETIKNFTTEFVINYKLDKTGIKDTFNTAISEAFKGNFDIPEYDIKMTLSKPKEASVEIEGKSVLVVVPVTVYLEKKTFLTDLKAKGTLEMSFITDLDIDSLWNVKTKTQLSHHRWVEKPKLSVAGLNLPIESISDVAINKSKSMIEKGIDDSVRENFTLKQKMKETMSLFDQPMQLDPSMSVWLNIRPEKFHLNKVINNRFSAAGKIGIQGKSTFTTYKPTTISTVNTLPKVYWTESIPDRSVFRIIADIKTADINPVIKANLDGKTFTAGDKSITLSNIVTNCDYEFLRVVTDIAGTVNGTLIIKGKPKYDANENSFYMENIDIQLKTKNVAHKAAAWIAEGKIRNELEKMLKFSIKDNLAEAQKNIDNQLKDLNAKYDLEMKIGIGSADVESFELKPGQIEAMVKAKFYLELRIKNFRSFNKF
ncbi:MAG: DUF4403 family protein [Saprospiraceae bacterium]|nr:DUF4403 family protein [Saprospiraceae bacterium]